MSKRKLDSQRGPASTLGQFPQANGGEPPAAPERAGNGPAASLSQPAGPNLRAPDGPADAPTFQGPAASAARPAGAEALHPLELRVRRLEDALAQLQCQTLPEKPIPEAAAAAPPNEQPVAAPAAPSPTAVVLEVAQRLVRPAAPAAAPALPRPVVPPASRPAWLFWEAFAEARAILRMYLDPRYRLSWLGRILPLVIVAAIALSDYWFIPARLPVVGWLLDKAVDLVLAFVLFKVLGHEARRYRETAPDLPPSLRL